MVLTKKGGKKAHLLAALWGIPSLLTLIEAYRLAHLPKYYNVKLSEGPAGYMLVIGCLLMGFSLWEIGSPILKRKWNAPSNTMTQSPVSKKVWFTLVYMILFLTLIPILGFVLASGCFLVVSLRLLGCSIKLITATVLLYCGGLYWVVPSLGLSLPRGILGI